MELPQDKKETALNNCDAADKLTSRSPDKFGSGSNINGKSSTSTYQQTKDDYATQLSNLDFENYCSVYDDELNDALSDGMIDDDFIHRYQENCCGTDHTTFLFLENKSQVKNFALLQKVNQSVEIEQFCLEENESINIDDFEDEDEDNTNRLNFKYINILTVQEFF